MNNDETPTAIDLFCGVGGMSLGFEQAGFRVMGAFDIEERHVEMYRKNFACSHAFVLDLSDATGKQIRQLSLIGNRSIDVVFGGPPCQGFSVGGKRRPDDPRNSLLAHFARIIGELKPRYFVAENVEGLMLDHAKIARDSFLSQTRAYGFNIVEPIQVLDASDYGVPQRRRRTFILGYRKGLSKPAYPDSSGSVAIDGKIVRLTVKDAISDLPKIDQIPHLFERDEVCHSLQPTSHYAKLMRGEIADPFDRSKHRGRKSVVLTGCLRTRHSDETIKRFVSTPPGAAESVSRYIRLNWDDVAPTIRAGTANDHGSHTAPRPIHPTEPRCITVREAARLHSFPDWFQFHSTRWHGFRQIGNSVPPRMARAIADVFMSLALSSKGVK